MAVSEQKIHREDIPLAGAGIPHIKWGWILAYGILLIIGAIVVLANPVLAGLTIGIILGIVLCIYGVAAVITGFSALSGTARWIEVILGVIAFIAGCIALFNPVSGALSLVWAIGVWLLVSGVFELIFAFKATHDKGWRFFLAALDIILGLILVTAGPGTGLAYLAIIVAIRFFFRGIFMVVLSFSVRKVGKFVHGRS